MKNILLNQIAAAEPQPCPYRSPAYAEHWRLELLHREAETAYELLLALQNAAGLTTPLGMRAGKLARRAHVRAMRRWQAASDTLSTAQQAA